MARTSPLLARGRLLRLSLAPSAAADVAAGLVVGGGGAFPGWGTAGLLIGASLCVYHGGMALNDWADRAEDARARPERPIPSGSVPPAEALATALVLLVAGAGLAAAASARAGLWMAAVASLAALYDLAGRGPLRGPLLLAACRAGNLGVGVFYAGFLAEGEGSRPPPWGAGLCLLYGAYVLFASRLGRLEDLEDRGPLARRPTRALLLAAGVLGLLPFVHPEAGPRLRPDLAAGLVAWSAAAGLAWTALRTPVWSRALAGRATGQALRRLLAFSAACALLGRTAGVPDGWWVAAACLAGYPLALALRQVFPPS